MWSARGPIPIHGQLCTQMRIVTLSDDETAGGAAVAASRLAAELTRAGAEVTRVVCRPDGLKHPWRTRVLPEGRCKRLTWLLTQRLTRRASVVLAIAVQRLVLNRTLAHALNGLRPEVIAVDNLHGVGWWPDVVSVCLRHAPTVWTLHDMWSFTGRCAYGYECTKFITGCDGTCPMPRGLPGMRLTISVTCPLTISPAGAPRSCGGLQRGTGRPWSASYRNPWRSTTRRGIGTP